MERESRKLRLPASDPLQPKQDHTIGHAANITIDLTGADPQHRHTLFGRQISRTSAFARFSSLQ